MARCPYLDYDGSTPFGNYDDKYICKLCGKQMDVDDSRVKYTCKVDYGEEYKNCPIYKDR